MSECECPDCWTTAFFAQVLAACVLDAVLARTADRGSVLLANND